MTREGLPTIRIRTFDENGILAGEVLLSPDTARTVGPNLETAVESLATLIDATGGVHHGGAIRISAESGGCEIAWSESGTFDDLGFG